MVREGESKTNAPKVKKKTSKAHGVTRTQSAGVVRRQRPTSSANAATGLPSPSGTSTTPVRAKRRPTTSAVGKTQSAGSSVKTGIRPATAAVSRIGHSAPSSLVGGGSRSVTAHKNTPTRRAASARALPRRVSSSPAVTPSSPLDREDKFDLKLLIAPHIQPSPLDTYTDFQDPHLQDFLHNDKTQTRLYRLGVIDEMGRENTEEEREAQLERFARQKEAARRRKEAEAKRKAKLKEQRARIEVEREAFRADLAKRGIVALSTGSSSSTTTSSSGGKKSKPSRVFGPEFTVYLCSAGAEFRRIHTALQRDAWPYLQGLCRARGCHFVVVDQLHIDSEDMDTAGGNAGDDDDDDDDDDHGDDIGVVTGPNGEVIDAMFQQIDRSNGRIVILLGNEYGSVLSRLPTRPGEVPFLTAWNVAQRRAGNSWMQREDPSNLSLFHLLCEHAISTSHTPLLVFDAAALTSSSGSTAKHSFTDPLVTPADVLAIQQQQQEKTSSPSAGQPKRGSSKTGKKRSKGKDKGKGKGKDRGSKATSTAVAAAPAEAWAQQLAALRHRVEHAVLDEPTQVEPIQVLGMRLAKASNVTHVKCTSSTATVSAIREELAHAIRSDLPASAHSSSGSNSSSNNNLMDSSGVSLVDAMCPSHVGKATVLEALNTFLSSPGADEDTGLGCRGIFLHGGPGCGKSVFLKSWARNCAPSNAVVIKYFATGGTEIASLQSMYAHILKELRKQIPLDLAVPLTPEDAQRDFVQWLVLACSRLPADRTLILLLDGADHMWTREDQGMSWLSSHLLHSCQGLRIILSARTGSPCQNTLQAGMWASLELSPLTCDEKVVALNAMLKPFIRTSKSAPANPGAGGGGKKGGKRPNPLRPLPNALLSPHVTERIVAAPVTANPMVLGLVVYALIATPPPLVVDRAIVLLDKMTVWEVADVVLSGIELAWSGTAYKGAVRKLFTVVSVSGLGILESDLGRILRVPASVLTALLYSASPVLVRDGPGIRVRSYLITEAMWHRYLPEEKNRILQHMKLVGYYEKFPVKDRWRAMRLAFHQLHADDFDDLGEHLSRFETLNFFDAAGLTSMYLGYAALSGWDSRAVASHLCDQLAEFTDGAQRRQPGQLIQAILPAANLLVDIGQPGEAALILEHTKTLVGRTWPVELDLKMCEALIASGDFEEAQRILDQVAVQLPELNPKVTRFHHRCLAALFFHQGKLHRKAKEYDDAIMSLQQAKLHAEKGAGKSGAIDRRADGDLLAPIFAELAVVHHARGHSSKAVTLTRSRLDMLAATHGVIHRYTVQALVESGRYRLAAGQVHSALGELRQAVKYAPRVFAEPSHPTRTQAQELCQQAEDILKEAAQDRIREAQLAEAKHLAAMKAAQLKQRARERAEQAKAERIERARAERVKQRRAEQEQEREFAAVREAIQKREEEWRRKNPNESAV